MKQYKRFKPWFFNPQSVNCLHLDSYLEGSGDNSGVYCHVKDSLNATDWEAFFKRTFEHE